MRNTYRVVREQIKLNTCRIGGTDIFLVLIEKHIPRCNRQTKPTMRRNLQSEWHIHGKFIYIYICTCMGTCIQMCISVCDCVEFWWWGWCLHTKHEAFYFVSKGNLSTLIKILIKFWWWGWRLHHSCINLQTPNRMLHALYAGFVCRRLHTKHEAFYLFCFERKFVYFDQKGNSFMLLHQVKR